MKSENLFESQGGPIILSQVKTWMEQVNALISDHVKLSLYGSMWVNRKVSSFIWL